jgi:hypothetical protein
MPYVTVDVWVDDPIPECDGNCERGHYADKIEDRIAEAIRAIDLGDVALARAYLDGTEKVTRSKQKLQLAYKAWKEGNLSGFIPYSGARQ